MPQKPLRKIAFGRIAEVRFRPKPEPPLLGVVKGLQARAQDEGRAPGELLDELEADGRRAA